MNRSWIPWRYFFLQLFFNWLVGKVFLVSQLLTISMSMRSPFLYIVLRNRKEIHRVLDEFLLLLCSFSQEVPARAADDADVPALINTLCTAFWVPCQEIRTV